MAEAWRSKPFPQTVSCQICTLELTIPSAEVIPFLSCEACGATPCSLANHLPHKRAQGVAPQASQLRKGMTSGLGMVSSRVQIWQLTVWGKGFERQASAMVSVLVAVALYGVLDSVRPPRTGSGAQAPGRFYLRP